MAKGDGPLTPEVISPKDPANRARAYRIRKALKEAPEDVPAEDQRWYSSYEDAQKSARASKRKHTVEYREETDESAAEGDAGAVAAAMAAPQLAKEEGRRYDSLILAAVQAMTASGKQVALANEMVLKMATQIMGRNESMENVHIKMLETIQKLFLAEAKAEAEEKAEKGGGLEGMIREMAPMIMAEWAKRNGVTPGSPAK